MKKLKELREENNLLQEEIASAIGVSRSTLSCWESGRYEPDIAALKRMSEYFGVSIDYLVENGNATIVKKPLDISEDEEELLFLYRGLPKNLKQHMVIYAKTLKSMALKDTKV